MPCLIILSFFYAKTRCPGLLLTHTHRRRICTEFIQCLDALAIFHQDDLKNKMIHPFLHIILVQFILFFRSSKRGKELNTFCPPNRRDDICPVFCINLSSMLIAHAHPPGGDVRNSAYSSYTVISHCCYLTTHFLRDNDNAPLFKITTTRQATTPICMSIYFILHQVATINKCKTLSILLST